MASAPSAALQAGASGASGVLVEMRGTLVLDDGVDRKKVPGKLHRPSLFLFGLFRQPQWGLFLWNISAKNGTKCFNFPDFCEDEPHGRPYHFKYGYLGARCGFTTFCLTSSDTLGCRQAAEANRKR